MNGRRWVVMSSLLAAVGQTTVPAEAEVVWIGPAMIPYEAYQDAHLCFLVNFRASGGSASATGLVRTRRATTVDALGQRMAAPWTTLVFDFKVLATTDGFEKICVGGAGATAVGGSVVFRIDLHTPSEDYVEIVQCTYAPGGLTC